MIAFISIQDNSYIFSILQVYLLLPYNKKGKLTQKPFIALINNSILIKKNIKITLIKPTLFFNSVLFNSEETNRRDDSPP